MVPTLHSAGIFYIFYQELENYRIIYKMKNGFNEDGAA